VSCLDVAEPGGDAAAGRGEARLSDRRHHRVASYHSSWASPFMSSTPSSSSPLAHPKLKRILERDETESVSDGRFNIARAGYPERLLLFTSFFHALIQMSMSRLVGSFFVMYVTVYGVFAAGWLFVSGLSEDCETSTGIHTYRDAFHLSLETQQTIGYGVPDPYFTSCANVTPLLVTQTLCGLLLDMVALNVLYQRFSSPVGRAMTIAFSKVAVLRVHDGHVHLVFRFCEIRKQPLLDVYVRVYCLQRVENPFVADGVEARLVALELEEPDSDAAEGRVLAPLPVTVVHQINKDSPLAPRSDDDSGEEEKHFSLESVKQFLMAQPFLEIIAVICGTDESSGNTVEARFSYVYEELRWNQVFASCVSVTGDGSLYVDFCAMHETVSAPCDDSAD